MESKKQVLIKGELKNYDYCVSGWLPLVRKKLNEQGYGYIGSSKTAIVDGQEIKFKKNNHFFIKV